MDTAPFIFRHEGQLIGRRDFPAAEKSEHDELLREVNKFTLRPLRIDEFAAFTLDLCNNQIDRHFSRFPEEELELINQKVVGASVCESHKTKETLPRGTFFRSRLNRDNDYLSVRPDAYFPRTAQNADFILNIEAGVYRQTSIGFSFRLPECSTCGRDIRTCDHVPGKVYGDKLCHFIMRGVIDVFEGSVVTCGSQGTGFVSQARGLPPLHAFEALQQARHHAPQSALWQSKTWSAE